MAGGKKKELARHYFCVEGDFAIAELEGESTQSATRSPAERAEESPRAKGKGGKGVFFSQNPIVHSPDTQASQKKRCREDSPSWHPCVF